MNNFIKDCYCMECNTIQRISNLTNEENNAEHLQQEKRKSNCSLQDCSKSEKFNETPQVIAQIQQVPERKSEHFDDVGNKNDPTETNNIEEQVSAAIENVEYLKNQEKELYTMLCKECYRIIERQSQDAGNKNGSTETNDIEEKLSAVGKCIKCFKNQEKELSRMKDEKHKKGFDGIKF